MKTNEAKLLIFFALLWLLWACATHAAPLPGTIVAAEIVPGGDDANTFPIGSTAWMRGTMKQVPDTATRDLISAQRRTEGMFCYVTGETNLYALVGGTNNANWVLWASGTNTGGATIVAAGTNIVVQLTGNTNTVSLADPVMVMEADVGTLFVTNPISRLIVTNLQAFSNHLGDVVITNSLSVTGQVTLNGTLQLLEGGILPNAVLGTDGGQDAVSYSVGFGLTLNSGTISNTAPYSNITVSNYVETNIFQTIHVLTNFFDTVYITNKLELEFLNPSQFVATDANRDLVSILNGNTLTNISPTNVDLVAGSGVALSTNNHRVTVSATGSGGTVTSVGLQTTGTGLSVSGTPVTTSGTLSLDSPSLVVTNNWAFVLRGSNDVRLDITHAFFPSNATVSTVAKIGADNTLTNIPNGTGALTNNNSGAFGWYNNFVPDSRTITVAGTANQITSSAGAQDLSANRTWALSLPDPLIAPGKFSANDITNLAFSVAGYVTNLANGQLKTTPTIPNGGLANSSITVNGTANHITTTSATISLGGSATLDVGSSVALVDANNAWTTGSSNNIAGPWTFSVTSNNTTPDMAVPESTLSTNNAFTFLAPTHVAAAGANLSQWILIHVTNSLATAKQMTSPTGATTVGTPWMTNTTDVYVNVLSSSGSQETNFFYIPKK